MQKKIAILAAGGLLALSACAAYQDYPNDSTAVEPHRTGEVHHMHNGHPHHDHGVYGHTHADHHLKTQEEMERDRYLRQNEDKWQYKSCPPGAAKRGDC